MTRRRSWPRPLLCLLLPPAAAGGAIAQEGAAPAAVAPVPVAGDTVRLLIGPPTQRRRGAVVSVAGDAIALRLRGADSAALVPWSRIYRIEASRGRGPSSENVPRGVAGGAFAGVSAAYLFFSADMDRIGRRVGVGSTIGAAVGTAVALWRPGPHRWQEVFRPDAPALEATAATAGRGGRASLAPSTHVSLAVQGNIVPMEPVATTPKETIGARGMSVRVGTYGLIGGPLPYLEAFYSHVRAREEYGTPELNYLGVLAGAWTSRAGASSRLSLFGGAGLALLRARVERARPCVGGLLCVGYGSGSVVMAVPDVGAFVSLLEVGAARRRLGLRADGRLHLPITPKGDAGASARTRGEVAVGLQVEL